MDGFVIANDDTIKSRFDDEIGYWTRIFNSSLNQITITIEGAMTNDWRNNDDSSDENSTNYNGIMMMDILKM